VFPIRDFAGTAELDFVHYELEDPKYDVEECRQRGITYAAPMKVTLRLIVFEVDEETGPLGPRYQGAGRLHGRHAAHDRQRHLHHQRHRARDRRQMHRSPGVFFDHDKGKTHSSGKLCSPRASSRIAVRGSISSSTPRTSSTSASTASASCR
jgi:DNA-directed RNA polymerase subunit beta